jgi:tRNA dimethylallyltransferase
LIHGLIDSPVVEFEIRQGLQKEAGRVGKEVMLERLRDVDPELAAGLHPNNLVRVIRALEVYRLTGIPLSRYQKEHAFALRRYDTMQIGVSVDRALLYRRIERRVERMLADGLLDEVSALLAAGYCRDHKSMRSIGYKEATAHLCGELSSEEAVRLIKRDTRHYAKRQLTWFKADPDILWFEYPEKFATILEVAIEFFKRQEADDNVQNTF